ncbi:hypothetical protein ACNKF0_09335 [Nocardioides sp. T5]|uniref:hypothetical protein n=1 Tax=Nocardioides sp. T5 TaxID=3400182 RepID=UPI003A874643
MKKIVTVLVTTLTLALTGVALVQAPAAAVIATVTVSAPDVAQPTYGCPCAGNTVDFQVVTPDSTEYLKYTYEVLVTDPAGNFHARWADTAYYGGHWQWNNYLLPSIHEYGTYTVTATVRFYGYEGNVPIDTRTATDTFTFNGPPAPPPVQIGGQVAETHVYKYTRKFSAMLESDTSTGSAPGIPVTWKIFVNGRLGRTLTQSWAESDYVTVRLPKKKRTKRVRVAITRNGQKVFSRAYKIPGTKS